jgi:hypothetical protein
MAFMMDYGFMTGLRRFACRKKEKLGIPLIMIPFRHL